MKKGKIGAIILGAAIIVGGISTLFCMERVPTGYVGVIYSMNGGVQDEVLTQGFHLVSPTKKVKEFSIGNEQFILSRGDKEGGSDDESFLVSTSDNANIKISFQMSYRYNPETVVETHKRFKGMNGEEIVNQRVRTVLKSKISEITTNYTMMDIYSGNRGAINLKITKFLNDELSKQFGIEVIDASIIDVHPDEQLEQTIKDRVKALQKKQQAEAEQETIKVQAETKLIQAKNDADIAKQKAEGEADAKKIMAEADAKANKMLAESITEELIKLKEVEARQKHGWITVKGGNAIVDTRK